MSSPTTRTVAHMRSLGYACQVVETYNFFTKRRNDLFTVIDVLCIGHGETVGVQTTSGSNVSSRVKKIADCEFTPAMRDAGWKILVHGWSRGKNGRYSLREVDCS